MASIITEKKLAEDTGFTRKKLQGRRHCGEIHGGKGSKHDLWTYQLGEVVYYTEKINKWLLMSEEDRSALRSAFEASVTESDGPSLTVPQQSPMQSVRRVA